MNNCAFGPHAALIHLRDSAVQKTEVTLRSCSAMLTDGVAFLLDDDLTGRIDVRYSLFSRPTDPDEFPAASASLIRRTGDGATRAAANSAADNPTQSAADDRAADRVLRRRLLHRHQGRQR